MKKIFSLLCLFLLIPSLAFGATATTFMESGTDATQDFTFYDTAIGGGTKASDTTRAHTGPRALKFTTKSGGVFSAAGTLSSVVTDSGSQVSFYFNIDTLPSSNTVILELATNNSGTEVASVTLTSAGVLQMTPLGATAVNGTTPFTANTWHRISVSYFITNTTTFGFNLYLDGHLEATANAGTLTRVGTAFVRFGFVPLRTNANIGTNGWLDDVYTATGGASSASQPDTGDIRVTAKRPNANGTTNGYTTQIGAGGSGYGTGHSPQVNEQPLSTTNGWSMVGAGSAVTEEYNVEDLTTGDVNIAGDSIVDYMGWVYSSSLASETGQIIVNNVSSNIALTSANTMFTQVAGSTSYPAGSGTDIGEITSTALTTVSLYETGILVAFIQPAFSPWQFWDF